MLPSLDCSPYKIAWVNFLISESMLVAGFVKHLPDLILGTNTRYCVDYRVPDRDDNSMYRKPEVA